MPLIVCSNCWTSMVTWRTRLHKCSTPFLGSCTQSSSSRTAQILALGRTNLSSDVQDLNRAMPELGRGLQQLLDFEGNVESTFAQSFEVQYDFFGELHTVELKPGGSGISITNDNRAEFVRLLTDYYLNKAVEEQFSAFASGFLEVRSHIGS